MMYHTWTYFFGPLSTNFHEDVLFESLDFHVYIYMCVCIYIYIYILVYAYPPLCVCVYCTSNHPTPTASPGLPCGRACSPSATPGVFAGCRFSRTVPWARCHRAIWKFPGSAAVWQLDKGPLAACSLLAAQQTWAEAKKIVWAAHQTSNIESSMISKYTCMMYIYIIYSVHVHVHVYVYDLMYHVCVLCIMYYVLCVIYMYMYMHLCLYTYMYMLTYAYTYTCTMYVCMCVCVYVCMYVCV